MTTHALSEDDIYRTSSQFRIWSFAPERLAALRKSTHELAIERIQAQRKNNPSEDTSGGETSYLNGQEELRLVQRYCEQIGVTSDHLKWPKNVKATAVQFLRRFYISNSVMTYPPKEIYKTALFLACKTEATHVTLSDYSRRISSKPEDILAPEYKLMQALRFTLEVKQPYRGLKGALMEMLNMVDQQQTQYSKDRIESAYHAARALLDKEALLSDVYFLYTPSQIMFASLLLADSELGDFYLTTKIADSPYRSRIIATVKSCGEMLKGMSLVAILTKDERAAMEARLERCRDPSTRDLVKAHQAKKAEAHSEERVKQRQLDRERQEQEGHDLFGPSIQRNGAG